MGTTGAGSAHLWRILLEKVELLRTGRKPKEAGVIASRAFEVATRAFAAGDARIVETLEIIAELALQTGDHQEARTRYDEVFAHFQAAGDRDAQARVAGTLGMICRALGDTEEAAEHYRQCMETNEDVHGADFPDMATMANNLALIHLERGEHEIAEAYYQRALQACRERNGEANADVAMLLNNLGILYFNQERHAEAEQMHTEAHTLRTALGDPAAVAQSASNLATVYHATGRLQEAEASYLAAIRTIESAGVPPTDDYRVALQNYALLLRSSGNPRKAKTVEDRAARLEHAA